MNISFSGDTDTSFHKKQRIHFFSHDSLVNNVDMKQRILVHVHSCIGYKNPDLDFPKKCTLHVHVMCQSIRLLLSAPRARCVPCLRVHFFKKIQDWFLNSERIRKRILRFFAKQINPRSLGSWCIKGTEESTLEIDSSVPLTPHDSSDLGLICLIKKLKLCLRILSDLRIQSWVFLKKTHANSSLKIEPLEYMIC